MAKATIFTCTTCEGQSPRWVGRCSFCGGWNTLQAPTAAVAAPGRDAVSLHLVSGGGALPIPTGMSEVDRVLGGGFVPGSVTLVFGPPGVGKSTLLFQVLASVASSGVEVLLASAEESLTQVSGRAWRIGPVPEGLLALEGHDVVAIETAIERHQPGLVVVDSIQSISDDALAGAAGSLLQVNACVERLTRLAKLSGIPVVLVGHVTKDGDLAGPRAIEHLVDTVISFDGDRHHAIRVLTAVKHRFGPAGEVGIFEMREDGLRAVPDPGPLLLGDRMTGVPGSVVMPVLQGRRPLLVEIQALVNAGQPGARPHALGVDGSRLSQVLAVMSNRVAASMSNSAVFVAAVGGINVYEPAADLAIALAINSATDGGVLPPDLIAFGELGLAGEIRMVPGADRRLAEAYRAGFTRALVPASTPQEAIPTGMEALRVRTLLEAIGVAFDDFTGTMPPWLTVAASR
jgi:DNA repair protein RadA/Sms